ncbi:hypothetical protein D3C76_834790 [compost metagenome]
MAGLKQRIMSTGIQPCKPAPEHFNVEGLFFEIDTVDIGNLQFATFGRLDTFCYLDNLVVEEIQTSHRVAGFRPERFFFNTQGSA